MDEHVSNIEEFISEFSLYYSKFAQFYTAHFSEKNKYYLGHPELIESSYRLQAKFILLPDLLRERLLDIEFDLFLHCHNIVDFYSLRKYIVDNNLFYSIATMVERVDGEVKTALEVYKLAGDEEYSRLPQRNYNFFQSWDQVKIISNNQIHNNQDSIENDELLPLEETDSENITIKSKENQVGSQKELLSKLEQRNQVLESVEKTGNATKGILESGLEIISLVARYI